MEGDRGERVSGLPCMLGYMKYVEKQRRGERGGERGDEDRT